MTFGEQVIATFAAVIKENIFIIILMVTFTLFCLDYYHRFLRLNKNTDHINLVDRYIWLHYYKSRRNK